MISECERRRVHKAFKKHYVAAVISKVLPFIQCVLPPYSPDKLDLINVEFSDSCLLSFAVIRELIYFNLKFILTHKATINT